MLFFWGALAFGGYKLLKCGDRAVGLGLWPAEPSLESIDPLERADAAKAGREEIRGWQMNKKQVIARLMAVVILGLMLRSAPAVRADGKSQAAKEVAEYVLQRFGRQVVREGSEALARKIELAAARHGDEVFEAVRKVGPRALPLVEEAGAHGSQAARIMAQHGEARGDLGGVAAQRHEAGAASWRRSGGGTGQA